MRNCRLRCFRQTTMQQGSESVDWEQDDVSCEWWGNTGSWFRSSSSPGFSTDELAPPPAPTPPPQLQPHPPIRRTVLFATASSFLLHPHPQPPPVVVGGSAGTEASTTGLQETLQSLSKGSQRHGLQRQMSTAAATSFNKLSWSSMASACCWTSEWWRLLWSIRARVRADETLSDSWSGSGIPLAVSTDSSTG